MLALVLVLAHILVTVMWFLVGCLCLGALCLVFAAWIGPLVVVVLAFTLISVYAFIILLRPKMRLACAEHILSGCLMHNKFWAAVLLEGGNAPPLKILNRDQDTYYIWQSRSQFPSFLACFHVVFLNSRERSPLGSIFNLHYLLYTCSTIATPHNSHHLRTSDTTCL